MRKYLSYIRIGLTAGVGLIIANFRYFRKFAKHPEKYPIEYRYAVTRKIVLKVLKRFHVDDKVEGFENYEKLNGKCRGVVLFNAGGPAGDRRPDRECQSRQGG